jgi:8-oxo-dGTP pyrophosphatase MutT (NUDIX family)
MSSADPTPPDPGPNPTREAHARTQFAALCWREHAGALQVLLVTSRDTGRWIVPKGWPMSGRSAFEAAAREAWEEAGVEGAIATDPMGEYDYRKALKSGAELPVRVELFPLRVAREADAFPEAAQRRRRWFAPHKAARRVAEPGLGALILRFAELWAHGRGGAPGRAAEAAPSDLDHAARG